jgi:predicted PurR-regulated permease PerM
MKKFDSANASSFENKFFVLLLVLVSLGFLLLLSPFYGAVFWGAVFAIVFAPWHARLLKIMPTRRTLTAVVALLFILLLVILPLVLLSALLVQEASVVFQRLQSGELSVSLYFQQIYEALPNWATALLSRFGLTDMALVQERVAASLKQGGQFFATQALNIGQNTFNFVMSFFIMLYLLFFFLRDGSALARRMTETLPLDGDIKRDLSSKFIIVIRATVKGNVVVAMVQGALGGLIFWILDIHAPVLWGTLMAFLSLLPAIGAAIVWLPVAIYFLLTGEVLNGLLLAAFGVLVIGLVDNVLRPLLVGKDTKLPDYVVLMSTIGGMALFGLNGFVIGPVIAAMFIAAWDLFAISREMEPLVPVEPVEPVEPAAEKAEPPSEPPMR